MTTEDSRVEVVDIPLLFGAAHGLSSNGLSPPVGLMPFNDHVGSQENSLSCDQFSLSCDQARGSESHGHDDILIMGSLSEIGTHGMPKKEVGVASYPDHTHHTKATKEWYADADDDDGDGDGGGDMPSLNSLGQLHDPSYTYQQNSSDEGKYNSSTAVEDSSTADNSSMAVGPIALKKGRSSLEALTRVESDKDVVSEVSLLVSPMYIWLVV